MKQHHGECMPLSKCGTFFFFQLVYADVSVSIQVCLNKAVWYYMSNEIHVRLLVHLFGRYDTSYLNLLFIKVLFSFLKQLKTGYVLRNLISLSVCYRFSVVSILRGPQRGHSVWSGVAGQWAGPLWSLWHAQPHQS